MIEIKELTTLEEIEKIGELEKSIWGMTPLPMHQTLTAVKNGGIVIGAFDNEKIIGFSYGFAGFKDGFTYLCSHMLGIDESYRSKRIGQQLKEAQAKSALKKGYAEMHWTFDPLETRNAYLNLSKLGGIVNVYMENAYGKMTDGINKGLPSDCFEVHWFLSSEHRRSFQAPSLDDALVLNEVSIKDGVPSFSRVSQQTLTEPVYGVKVPKDFQHVKKIDSTIALNWRLKTREIFQALFKAGYAAVHLYPEDDTATYIFVPITSLNLEAYK
ncbi:GNAT family N-acetyltransferase [Jeotgalicoccus sp. ATCC 8456]|uniref:GNAT family N-acetyltransferase n=1 Tax=Jeotgalicoccus sp. ATCC 8456 TaxID=946435 RepID=UPI0018E5DD81|nr:GNAT family N-acetyltransferase [Jeotgalicoccus sp. ATCC 8456]QQD84380.1 GNAT family N-acetyltransferase [Jeotgalicoccus sp. ATCC 8456]